MHIRAIATIFAVILIAGCSTSTDDGGVSPAGHAFGGRISGDLTMGTEAWPPAGPGFVHFFGDSFDFRAPTGGPIIVYGNWTPQTPAAETLQWTIVKEMSSSGEIVAQEEATRSYVGSFEAQRQVGYRIEIHTPEGGAMSGQQVHVDVLGPSDLKFDD